ncbi:MAG TPA: 1,2-phenylacetyl-CoA epoxidase subunit PaaC [Woeseiaceae bacterium]
MDKHEALFRYVLRLGDNALILGQRLAELVTSAPELEEELAVANFSLDYIGQARLFYSYAGELEGKGRVEDDFAFLRDEREFENVLLVEQPNGHFGDTIVRQFLFESFYALQLEALTHCGALRLAEIAVRAEKELRYHLRHASQWMLRLGDGTDESHARMQDSLNRLWRYSGELFAADELDETFQREWQGPQLSVIGSLWQENVAAVLKQATLEVPENQWMDGGGRSGRHSEQFGYLIAEMQYMQRAWPGAQW